MSDPNEPQYPAQPSGPQEPQPPFPPGGQQPYPSYPPQGFPAAGPVPGYAPYPYGAPSRWNVLAVVAFIGAFIVSPVGIVCGHIALHQIKRTGEKGHGLALAGTVLGYVFTILSIVIVAVIVISIIVVCSAHGGTGCNVQRGTYTYTG